MSEGDRRGAPRARVSWPASVEAFDGRVLLGQVVDLSTSGACVRVPGDLAEKSGVTLRVVLPDGIDRLEVVARVARRQGEEVALDFMGLPETEARRVRPLLDGWEARRRSPRARVEQPVVIDGVPAGPVAATLEDMSAFGARVRGALGLQPGDRVALVLDGVDGHGAMRLPAVVWTGAPAASVLVFTNLGEAEFRRLHAHVERLRGGRP